MPAQGTGTAALVGGAATRRVLSKASQQFRGAPLCQSRSPIWLLSRECTPAGLATLFQLRCRQAPAPPKEDAVPLDDRARPRRAAKPPGVPAAQHASPPCALPFASLSRFRPGTSCCGRLLARCVWCACTLSRSASCLRSSRSSKQAGQRTARPHPACSQAPNPCACATLPRPWPPLQGTAPEIFERIEANARFVLDLDQRIMPGTKHVPRWVQGTGGERDRPLRDKREQQQRLGSRLQGTAGVHVRAALLQGMPDWSAYARDECAPLPCSSHEPTKNVPASPGSRLPPQLEDSGAQGAERRQSV